MHIYKRTHKYSIYTQMHCIGEPMLTKIYPKTQGKSEARD